MPLLGSSKSKSPLDTRSNLPELREFLVHLASECGLADNSLHAYRRDLECVADFFAPLGISLSKAAADDFRAFLQDQSRRLKSTRTVARRLAAIKHFLQFQQRPDLQQILSQLDRPKPESSLPHVLSIAHVQQLISAPNPKDRLYFRDVAILELLYASGLRASELCDVKTADANLQVSAIRVLGKGNKERVVPMGQAAVEAIENYLKECRPKLDKNNSPLLFLSRAGKPMERVGLWMLVEKYGRKSGLLNEVHPHVLRHCFASHLLSGGADLRVVQELLGHADIATTQIYTHVDQKRLKATHLKYHPRG
jgi:integrase/recombinase XerD